jgi:putative spermidine/putrescine transport system ATP-binding protein
MALGLGARRRPELSGGMSGVSLERLVKRYGQTEVVKVIDLEIAEGELLVLLGPSGCGKTTTLRMIAGFTDPSAGTIRIGAEVVNKVPPRLRNLGMVFQDYALFPNMTVAENIGFGLEERGRRRAEVRARVDETLRLIQLDGFGGRFPAELSGGQQQRVALARALAYEPRVLLMDEPLGALDQKLREDMQREFARLQRRLGITTIFVTHDQQEAMALADRIVVMNEGSIEQCGRPEDLYDAPRTLFIADFIGRNNRLPGVIERRNGLDAAVRLADGNLVMARLDAVLEPGAEVVCVIRPERLHLVAFSGDGTTNRLPVRLLRRSFQGASTDVMVELPSGQELIVRQAAGGPSIADVPGLSVSFAGADLRCFPAARA